MDVDHERPAFEDKERSPSQLVDFDATKDQSPSAFPDGDMVEPSTALTGKNDILGIGDSSIPLISRLQEGNKHSVPSENEFSISLQKLESNTTTGLKKRTSTYVNRPRSNKNWSEAQMTAAIEDVLKKKLTLRAAAAIYGIPRATLFDRMHSRKDRAEKTRKVNKFSLPGNVEEKLRTRAIQKYAGASSMNLVSLKDDVFRWAKSAWIDVHKERLQGFPSVLKKLKVPEPNDTWFGGAFLKDKRVQSLFSRHSSHPPIKFRKNVFVDCPVAIPESCMEQLSQPSERAASTSSSSFCQKSLNSSNDYKDGLDSSEFMSASLSKSPFSSFCTMRDDTGEDIVRVEPLSPVPDSKCCEPTVPQGQLSAPYSMPATTSSDNQHYVKVNNSAVSTMAGASACTEENQGFCNFENPEVKALKDTINALEANLSPSQLSMFLDRYYKRRQIDRLYDIWAGLMDRLQLLNYSNKDT